MNVSNTKDEFLELIRIVKEYIILNKDYTLLQITEKLSQLLASILLILILLAIGVMTLFFVMLSGAYALAPYVGGLSWSLFIFGGLSLLVMLVCYLNRSKWLLSPIIGFVSALLIEGTSAERKATAEAEQEMQAAQNNATKHQSSDSQSESSRYRDTDKSANKQESTDTKRKPSIKVVPIGSSPSTDKNTITPTGSSSTKTLKK